MTDTPFTPGPWEHVVFSDDGERCWWEIDGCGGEHIAACSPHGGNARETELANARLIAKAPELLEALEERVLSDCSMCRGRKLDDPKLRDRCYNKACRVARYQHLIADAKGETNEYA